MSAIWGTVAFNNSISNNADAYMRIHYEQNCKLDRVETVCHDDAYFGCGIQYITKESEQEQLPYYNSEKKILFTADCILDNRNELLSLLCENDSTIPDGTLILHAYYKWGISCLKHLRGLFSFVIYDKDNQTIYLASDQMSSRCLYYYRNNEQITFSTLLKPIKKLYSGIKNNEYYLKDFLTAPGLMPNIISNETPYENVYKLNPGTYMKITPTNMEEISYWNPSFHLNTCNCHTAKEYGYFFHKLYEECVQDALRTNGNIGISLSSGLDSASVGALAADLLNKKSKNLYAYTYVPYEQPSHDKNKNNIHDETNDVNKIVSMHPNIKTHFLNNHGKNCFEDMPQGVNIMEIPYKAYGNLPSLCEVYKEAFNASCKIVLTGQMGNSTVSYGSLNSILYDLYCKKKYFTYISYVNQYCKHMQISRKKNLHNSLQYIQRQKGNQTFNYIPTNPFISKGITNAYPMFQRYQLGNTPTQNIPFSESSYHDYLYHKPAFTYLGELDTKLGLHFGILLRDPTRDMRILSFCHQLPYNYFTYKGTPRWLIRGNMKDILPNSILNNWIRYGVQNSDFMLRIVRDWDKLSPVIISQLDSAIISKYINQDKIQNFLNDNKILSPDEDDNITNLLMLNVLYIYLTS